MPEVRYYEVEQVRVVKVMANNEIDAAAIANLAFNTNGAVAEVDGPGKIWGHTVGFIEVTDIRVSREM